MRVLWLCNIMLPVVAEQLNRETSSKEGWLSGLAAVALERQRENGIELGVAFPAPADLEEGAEGDGCRMEVSVHEGVRICHGETAAEKGALVWYGFREDMRNPHIYARDLEPQMDFIIKHFRPDIVHCFGTEYPHVLAMCRVFPENGRLLVGIQGICKACADAYFADLPEKALSSVTLRDILRRDSIRQQQKKFELRAGTEREILRIAGNVTGRTEMDRQYAHSVNPNARYFVMNETLRPEFYEDKWDPDRCEPHSIFLSQGDYPLKGLHYMLLALPEICAAYPDTKVYVAGNSIVRYESFREKCKISGYGKYLRSLMKQGGLEGRVQYLGMLDARQMKERYLKSSLFVCCSSMENSPNSLGEAMLLGMPCVSADVGGVSSIFTGGEDGILYDNTKHLLSNSKNLADAVLAMWACADTASACGENARKHAKMTHDREANYRKLTEIYAEIAGKDAGETASGEYPPQIVFVSNYINHHQTPFCNVLYERLNGSFAFVQTEPMEEERVQMGWQDFGDLPYLKCYYQEPGKCRDMIENAKIVIFGGVEDESYIERRLQSGKPVIRCSERLYKGGQWKAVSPRGLRKKFRDHTRYRDKNVWLLCAGAYVASDFHIVRAYPGKMLKWGYFPETRHYDADKLMAGKQPASVLWVARLIDCKRPELPLECAKWLKDRGVRFHMDIVGDGDLRGLVDDLMERYELSDCVTLRGFCSTEEVRAIMEKTDIFLATSDRREGWGAVVNEAMNSGCAVIVSHIMGSAPYLIRHGENGFIFRSGQKKMLFELTEQLLADRELCQAMGRKAVATIESEWNAECAAERLLQFCAQKGLLKKEILAMEAGERPLSGPCSPAEIIGERVDLWKNR